MLLLQEAARRLGVWRLSDATLYVTQRTVRHVCRRDDRCADQARRLRLHAIRKAVPTAAHSTFCDHRKTNHRLEVTAGVLEDEAAAQLQQLLPRKAKFASTRRRCVCYAVVNGRCLSDHIPGEVVEWLKAPASKAGVPDEGTESSNLSLSAIKENRPASRTCFLFLCDKLRHPELVEGQAHISTRFSRTGMK